MWLFFVSAYQHLKHVPGIMIFISICSELGTAMITILMQTDHQYFFSSLTVFIKLRHSFPMPLNSTIISWLPYWTICIPVVLERSCLTGNHMSLKVHLKFLWLCRNIKWLWLNSFYKGLFCAWRITKDITVFWDRVPHILVDLYQCFRGTYCFHLHCIPIPIKIKAAGCSEM